MTTPILGIDIAKRKVDVVLLAEEKPRHKVFTNDARGFAELAGWIREHGALTVHACMEATGRYGEDLARFLDDAGHVVSVVNPAQIKAFGMSELSRTKTDKTDAGVIARFCLHHGPRPWKPAAPEIRELQDLSRYLYHLMAARQREKNRLHARIASTAVVESTLTVVECLDGRIREIRTRIREHIRRHATLKAKHDLLVTTPGIGETTAVKILAEIPDVDSFESARAAAAFAGVTPREHLSGSSVRGKARMSKVGNARLRKALYLPAVVAMRCNPIVRAMAERLRSRGKIPMVIVGAAMRKLLHIAYGILKHKKPFDPAIAVAR